MKNNNKDYTQGLIVVVKNETHSGCKIPAGTIGVITHAYDSGGIRVADRNGEYFEWEIRYHTSSSFSEELYISPLASVPVPEPEPSPMEGSADRKKYYCSRQKKHIWVLGYFGGGSINLSSAMEVAAQFSTETGIDAKTISIAEINYSRRFKNFKYLYSDALNQLPLADSIIHDNVFEWLFD